MVTWRRCGLFALVAFLLGGMLTAATLSRPAHEERKETTVAKAEVSNAIKMDDSWAWSYQNTTPPKEVVRWKKTYRPAPDGGCELASEEGTREKTGTAVVAASGKQDTHVEAKNDLATFNSKETSTVKREAPRWSAAVLYGIDRGLELQGAVTGSYRFWGPVTLNSMVYLPIQDPLNGAMLIGAGGTW